MGFPLFEILVLAFLTLLEGFFVAAEIALVSVRRSRIDQLVEENNAAARRVRRLIDDPGRFLAVSQLGLTLIGFFVLTVGGWLGGAIVFTYGMRVLNLVEEPAHRAVSPAPKPEEEAAEK